MAAGTWDQTLFTYIWVFNTGRGLAVAIRLPHNIGLVYDLGSSEDFSPAFFIAEHIVPRLTPYKTLGSKEGSPIAQCVLSHPHADHVTELDAILEVDGKKPPLYPALLTCPNDKDTEDVRQNADFSRIIRDDNRDLIAKYRAAYKDRTPPLQTIQSTNKPVPDVEYGIYYLRPDAVASLHPSSDQDYTNGLSILLYLRHGKQSVLIPGDITPECLEKILNGDATVEKRYTYFWNATTKPAFHRETSTQPALGSLLAQRGLSVLVAPHHGLESGFPERLFERVKGGKTQLNVISEKRHLSDTDGTVDARYQKDSTASGLIADIDGTRERRASVSTRQGHHILLVLRGTDAAPRAFLRSDPEELLDIT